MVSNLHVFGVTRDGPLVVSQNNYVFVSDFGAFLVCLNVCVLSIFLPDSEFV